MNNIGLHGKGVHWVEDLLMGFQDVVSLPSPANFTTSCLKTVVFGKQGHAICKIISLQQIVFCVSEISWRA